MKKICIIGMGKMGSAIHNRLLECSAFNVVAYNREDGSTEKLSGADIVVVAVKPQHFDGLSQSINGLTKDALVVSIMAGVSIETIQQKLRADRIIRSMPNLATAVGESATGWIAADACTEEDKETAHILFSSFGHQFELDRESELDAFVALAGSGPAYFFYLTQLLEEKAAAFGFQPDQARRIALYTFFGAAKAMEAVEKTPGEWVNAVASKGGTTEAALAHMKEHGFEEIFKNAVEAAKKRSEELR